MASDEIAIAERHLLDYKLAVEYKYLIDNAPGGVYLMPEQDNIRMFHGVIFVRRGMYRDGIFRFTIELPENYNSVGSYPIVTFIPLLDESTGFYNSILHPLINPQTGRINLKADRNMRLGWNPDKHFLITILLYIKKIFYLETFTEYDIDRTWKSVATPSDTFDDQSSPNNEGEQVNYIENDEAMKLFETDVVQYIQKLKDTSIKFSNDTVYTSHKHCNSNIIFTADHPGIMSMRKNILGSVGSVE